MAGGKLVAAALLGLLASLAVDHAATRAADAKPYYHSYLGKKPPELRSEPDHWTNAPAAGLSLDKLRGRVVWLEFNF